MSQYLLHVIAMDFLYEILTTIDLRANTFAADSPHILLPVWNLDQRQRQRQRQRQHEDCGQSMKAPAVAPHHGSPGTYPEMPSLACTISECVRGR